MVKIFVIDIDGTICENVRNEEGSRRMAEAKPFLDSIRRINQLYDEGHYVCLFTARTNEHAKVTEEWLKRHNVNHHQIIYNKPRKIGKYDAYHFVDDAAVRATTFKGKFTPFVKKNAEVEVFET
jgi:uncharacterized HAD superfamily protein